MKRDVRKLGLTSLFIIILSITVGTVNVWAKEKDGSLLKQIQGSWILISVINEQDGKKNEPFGPNPRGSMILTPDRHFSIILMRTSLPKFASNNRVNGTAEEYQAVVQGSLVDYGIYTVANEEENLVILHIKGCTFPNWAK